MCCEDGKTNHFCEVLNRATYVKGDLCKDCGSRILYD